MQIFIQALLRRKPAVFVDTGIPDQRAKSEPLCCFFPFGLWRSHENAADKQRDHEVEKSEEARGVDLRPSFRLYRDIRNGSKSDYAFHSDIYVDCFELEQLAKSNETFVMDLAACTTERAMKADDHSDDINPLIGESYVGGGDDDDHDLLDVAVESPSHENRNSSEDRLPRTSLCCVHNSHVAQTEARMRRSKATVNLAAMDDTTVREVSVFIFGREMSRNYDRGDGRPPLSPERHPWRQLYALDFDTFFYGSRCSTRNESAIKLPTKPTRVNSVLKSGTREPIREETFSALGTPGTTIYRGLASSKHSKSGGQIPPKTRSTRKPPQPRKPTLTSPTDFVLTWLDPARAHSHAFGEQVVDHSKTWNTKTRNASRRSSTDSHVQGGGRRPSQRSSASRHRRDISRCRSATALCRALED